MLASYCKLILSGFFYDLSVLVWGGHLRYGLYNAHVGKTKLTYLIILPTFIHKVHIFGQNGISVLTERVIFRVVLTIRFRFGL